ncbi:L,D-transpeptidase family protein [Streptomyces sp. NPDC002499]
MALSACGGTHHTGGEGTGPKEKTAITTAPTHGLPGVGDALRRQIPAATRQAVVVYGDGKDSPDATVALYTRHVKRAEHGSGWERTRAWPAHNGKKGWTADHHEGDKRSPVGVFTLSDSGGVLPDPGAHLPYTRSAAFAAPRWWAESHWHDFDYVIAIDYNRVKGTPPNDPTRPEGESRGGGIWLHMDHGSGTSGCVSLPKAAMEYLLRTLDPNRHPVVVMGDRADLKT